MNIMIPRLSVLVVLASTTALAACSSGSTPYSGPGVSPASDAGPSSEPGAAPSGVWRVCATNTIYIEQGGSLVDLVPDGNTLAAYEVTLDGGEGAPFLKGAYDSTTRKWEFEMYAGWPNGFDAAPVYSYPNAGFATFSPAGDRLSGDIMRVDNGRVGTLTGGREDGAFTCPK